MVCHHKSDQDFSWPLGADDEIRTRDPNLGKVVRYQLRHIRIVALSNVLYLIQPRTQCANRVRDLGRGGGDCYAPVTFRPADFGVLGSSLVHMAGSVGARIAKWTATILVLAVGAVGVLAYVNRGDIQDYLKAENFTPSERVQIITDTVAFTPKGERIFLASHPTVGGREEFSRWCANVDHAEEGHILGCYADERIRLFEVSDERLQGIVEVTAVHELLHAVFARMKPQDREVLSDALREEYEQRIVDDAEFETRMSVYADLSPRAFANELHSVFGTEVADIPASLEEHYAKWISDRGEVVEWYNEYHGVFTSLSAEADRLSAELEALREQIETDSSAYDEAVRQFNADAADFKARNERYEFSGNVELFDSVRSSLLFRQDELSAELQRIQADTDTFNSLRDELLALNDVSLKLNEVLDSKLPTPTAEPDSDH